MLERFLEAYDAVLVLDTETTGISCRKDEIIELAVLKAGQADGALCELETMDEFIRLSEGRRLPDKIVELTGITEQMLLDDGISSATPWTPISSKHRTPTAPSTMRAPHWSCSPRWRKKNRTSNAM